MHEEQMLTNALRFLCVDAISQANSGHPGAPLGMAEMAAVLWREFMHYDPKTPVWFNRDRFVLSNGHASTLLYALLHLTGYEITSEDLAAFRSLNSKTPGHPEFGVTPGVDTTTGPLGQGLANAVGMALTENMSVNYKETARGGLATTLNGKDVARRFDDMCRGLFSCSTCRACY